MKKTLRFLSRAVFWYAVFDSLILGYAGFVPGVQLAAAQNQGSQTLTTTTLSSAVSTTYANNITLASISNVTASAAVQTMLFVDGEAMLVATNTVPSSGTTVTVTRGVVGTRATTHASGATVYVGRPNLFVQLQPGKEPSGTCSSSSGFQGATVLPFINTVTARRWNCIGGQYMVDNGLVNLPPGACNSFVSGNSTGTNGLTNNGTSATFSVDMVQAQVSATGTNTLGFVCSLDILSGLQASNPKNVSLIDAVFYYGVQQAAIGTQAATLASGTMNGSTVFSQIALPTPAASETASTVAPVRSDSGSLTITPVVGSFNTATTTAGAFYSVRFTPASAFPLNVDLNRYYLTVNFQGAATTATTVNSPGLTVHYAYIPD
jgi:hypothetical protein